MIVPTRGLRSPLHFRFHMKKLTDKQVFAGIKNASEQLAKSSRNIVEVLREIERRKVYLNLGYPTLRDYLIEEINYSEEEAQEKMDALLPLAP